jgi:hypothetical protein
VVGRWAISSQRKSAFCRAEGLTPAALDGLIRQLQSSSQPPTSEGFVEVHLQREAPSVAFELDIPSGHRLHVPPGFDADDLARLLAVLEQRSC